MMVSDCPLAFCHKKGEYTCRGFLLLGGDFFFLYVGACGAIRLYLDASLCTYHFWLLMYCFWAIHVRGRYIYFGISISLFHILLHFFFDLYL